MCVRACATLVLVTDSVVVVVVVGIIIMMGVAIDAAATRVLMA